MKKYEHFMVDIETLGKGSNAAIVSIGATAFDLEGIAEQQYYVKVCLDDCLKYGKVDGSTLSWWLKQSEKARKELYEVEQRHPLALCLKGLSNYFIKMGSSKSKTIIWSCGAGFDPVLLENAYEVVGDKSQWEFWNTRCYRTMKKMHCDVPEPAISGNIKHNALADAVKQAQHLIAICKAKGVELK
jgi:hypothetical protein